jgi:hypothetical protein
VDVHKEVLQYPDAHYGIVVQRANAPPYPVAGMLKPQDGTLVWVVADYVTAIAGKVEIEFNLIQGATVMKSCSWTFFVIQSVSQGGGSMGKSGCCCGHGGESDAPSWIDELYQRADALDASIIDAQDNIQEVLDAIQEWQDGGGAGGGGGNTCGCTEMTEEEFQEIYDTIFNN